MDLTLPPRVTDRAFARLAEIAELTGQVKPLRVGVSGGGCSGFQYDIRLDEAAPDDLVLEKDGQKVLVDAISLPFLTNATIDFLRKPPAEQPLVAQSRLLKLGKRLAVGDVMIRAESGGPVLARAGMTYAIPPGSISPVRE